MLFSYSTIKNILNFRPELKPIEKEVDVVLRFPETEPLSPPILQLDEVLFRYNQGKIIFSNVNLSATLESRICIVSIFIFYIESELSSILINNCEFQPALFRLSDSNTCKIFDSETVNIKLLLQSNKPYLKKKQNKNFMITNYIILIINSVLTKSHNIYTHLE